MISWYDDKKLAIMFSDIPDVRPRYITPYSDEKEIASINKYPFANKKPFEVLIKDKETNRNYGFTIPEYNFDGMTIPRVAWSLLGVSKEDRRGLVAACLHDWLCLNKNLIWYDRALSTNIFNALLKIGGMNAFKRFIMKNSVACFQSVICDWRRGN